LNHPRYQSLLQAGYKFDRAFCGSLPEARRIAFTKCHMIFQYPNSSHSLSADKAAR
jgi:hypothetical protein